MQYLLRHYNQKDLATVLRAALYFSSAKTHLRHSIRADIRRAIRDKVQSGVSWGESSGHRDADDGDVKLIAVSRNRVYSALRVSSFSGERRMRSRDSQTYVPAKIYRSAMGVTCKMRRQSITTDGMHDDRVISNFCLASPARIAKSIQFPNGRIRANFLHARCT